MIEKKKLIEYIEKQIDKLEHKRGMTVKQIEEETGLQRVRFRGGLEMAVNAERCSAAIETLEYMCDVIKEG